MTAGFRLSGLLAMLALAIFSGCAKPVPVEAPPGPQAAPSAPVLYPDLADKGIGWEVEYKNYRKTHSQKASIAYMVDQIKHDPITLAVVGSTKLGNITVSGRPNSRTITVPAK
jgi:hypothetical protein